MARRCGDRVGTIRTLSGHGGSVLYGSGEFGGAGQSRRRRQRCHDVRGNLCDRWDRVRDRHRGFSPAAHGPADRVDRLYPGLDAAHLCRTQSGQGVSAQIRPPPRRVFCDAVSRGQVVVWGKLSLRHGAGVYPRVCALSLALARVFLASRRPDPARGSQQRSLVALPAVGFEREAKVPRIWRERRNLRSGVQCVQPAQ